MYTYVAITCETINAVWIVYLKQKNSLAVKGCGQRKYYRIAKSNSYILMNW